MNNEKLLERIVIDPKIMMGKPVIRGTRLTVQSIIARLAQGVSMEDLMKEYEGLCHEDSIACLLFASESLDDNTFLLLHAEIN